MVFIDVLQDYVSVDDEAIRIFSSSGMKKDIIMPSEDIDRVCHIRHINSFVGWKYKDCKLYVSIYQNVGTYMYDTFLIYNNFVPKLFLDSLRCLFIIQNFWVLC